MSRPTLTPKHTRASEERADAALNEGVKITVDGTGYEVRVGDITPQLARELRRETGASFGRLMEQLEEDPDIDVIATFVWFARRMAGERLALDDVAMTYTSLAADESFDISVLTGADEVGDSPEA